MQAPIVQAGVTGERLRYEIPGRVLPGALLANVEERFAQCLSARSLCDDRVRLRSTYRLTQRFCR